MDRAGWLLKALHEASGEVQEALLAADRSADAEAVLTIAWDLALAEHAGGSHVGQLLRGVTDLALHPAEWLATGPEAVEIRDLVQIYGRARAETCGRLWGLSSRSLEARGRHPFRGEISLENVLVGLHERDIETMIALRKLPAARPGALAR